jgi:hypothetical protein
MREEFDASQKVKHEAKIVVIIGNRPYDRFTGVAQAEEAELVAHYKGIEIFEETDKDDFGQTGRIRARQEETTRRESVVQRVWHSQAIARRSTSWPVSTT